MPLPIIYTGTQDDDRTRSIDVVHIEPSIREGVHLVSSLYGPEASAPLYRYPPTNTVDPWISGDTQIPNTLTCNEGQWPASPAANFTYQWMSDGIDLPGETNRTYTTDAAVDNTIITCEVRGYNSLGEAYAFTPGVAVTLIEPVEVRDGDFHVVTGLKADGDLTVHSGTKLIVTSGIGTDDRMDVNRGVAYFTTGRAADTRLDMNTTIYGMLTGMGSNDRNLLWASGAAVISYEVGLPLVDGVPQAMNLKNPQAELGNLGWDIFGAATHRYDPDFNPAQQDNRHWWGGQDVDAAQVNIPYSYMWQDVEVFPVWESDVDAGTTNVELYWYQRSYAQNDQLNVKVEFLNAAEVVIGIDVGLGLWSSPAGIWYYMNHEAPIPANTRFIRVTIEFNLQYGENNDAMVDSMSMFIRKGSKVTSRDFGPTFEYWRLKFTRANTYSGSSLSELEFRDGIGGNNLATGGTPISGSEGNGGLDDYAFDDLRNTGYWSGELAGISNGTAWIGYHFPSAIKPTEIDITARSAGSTSLETGRDFLLEGSDDGVNWHTVQQYLSIGDFTSGQQKQFVVLDGVQPYPSDTATNINFTRTTYSFDDYPSKGTIWQSKLRMDVTHVKFRAAAQVFPYKISIMRTNLQKTNGMVTEIHEVIDSQVSTGTNQWIEHALTTPLELEYGDQFAVVVSDMDADNNPDDVNEGRILYMTGITDWTPRDHTYATRVDTWMGNEHAFYIGFQNPSNHDYDFAVDFKGTVF